MTRAAGRSQHLPGSLVWNMAGGMRGARLLTAVWTFAFSLFGQAEGQGPSNDLTGFSLNPPYFNLAEGSRISATATCGQDEAGRPRNDLYCKLVGGPTATHPIQNIQGQFCDYCNSIDPNKAHPVTNAIDGTERWWQSPPLSRGLGYNEVNVTLDLGQLFHVAYVLIKFANSPRPDLWVLERSVDNGRTFTPWQYFAHSKHECIERFGMHPNARILHDDDQICTTDYSRIIPLENGEIVVSLINGRPGSRNFTYSPVLRDFTKATNIRLHFLRTNTLLGHLISKTQRDPTVTRRVRHILCNRTQCWHFHVSHLAKLNLQLFTTYPLSSFLLTLIPLTCSLLFTHSSSSRPNARSVCPVIMVIPLAETVKVGLDSSHRLQVQNMAPLCKTGEYCMLYVNKNLLCQSGEVEACASSAILVVNCKTML